MQLKFFLAASAASVSLACGLAAAPAFAQQITTGIEGTVSDADGNPIPGASVTVTDTRTGASRQLTTDGEGRFSAVNLVTGGPYTVSANAPGYEGQSLPDIFTSLQGSTSLTFTLSSGSGEIVVTGSRVQLTQLAVGPGQSFAGEVLENAPTFNRDVRDIIRIDPRVSLDRDDGGSGVDRISCLGGNDRGNAFTVDGISQGDVYGLNDTGFSSRSSTPIPYDAIRETQVQFAPFDVDYANFTGCAINVVTKSGTNDYKFGGFFEYSNSDLRGDELDDNGVTRNVPPINPERRYGVYLGGPVWKDRLFLFGAYEHQEAGQSQDDGPTGAGYINEPANGGVSAAQFQQISEIINRVYGIDTGPLVTNRDFTNDRYFVRADLQITDQHRLEATYQRLEEGTVRSDDLALTGTFGPTIVGENTFFISGTESNYYSGRLYSQWNDNLSTELRYSRSEVQDLQDPIGGGEAQDENPIPRIIVGIPNGPGNADDGAVQAGPGFSRSANDLRTTIDQMRAVMRLDAGAHKFKIGAELNRADLFNLFIQNATGALHFRNAADLEAGLLSPGTGNFNTTSSPTNLVTGAVEGAIGNFSSTGDPRDAAADFTRSIYSVFAQDDWQITDQLGAVLGVRVDWFDGGQPKLNTNYVTRYGFANTTGFSNIDPIIMPRLALTYDMDDFAVFSRAQLRGGVGIFSGGDPLVFFANSFQNDGRGFSQGTTQDSPCPAGQIDVVVNGQFTGIPECIRTAGAASAARGLGDTQSIDPDIKQPSVLRANVGFSSRVDFTEKGFFSGWDLNLDYIYSKYNDPLTIVDLAAVPATAAGPGGTPIGLNGFTIDGRPIYRSIDPSVAGCTARLVDITPTPIYTGVNAPCFNTQRDDELMLTNAGSYRSHIASAILSKRFDGGVLTPNGDVFFSAGYAYTDAQDRRNMFQSTAGSNYDNTAAFDRQNPAASRGFFGSRHNISVQTSFREEFFDDLSTRLGATFVARSGRPYSLTFTGLAVFGDSVSGSDNALIYLPTGTTDPNIAPPIFNAAGVQTGGSNLAAVQQLVDFASGLGCAKKHLGRTIPRNTCENDWYYDLDLSFSQELPGPGRFFGRDDKLKLYATMDNFLNFLDSGWNIQRRRNFSGLQDLATASGVDSQGRYIISTTAGGLTNFVQDNQINVSSSVWRLKVGISYDF